VECHAQLDSSCRPGHRLALARFKLVRLAVLSIALLTFGLHAAAQCGAGNGSDASVRELYDQHKWDQVIAAVKQISPRSPDEDFESGMALAHLQRWDEARTALVLGHRACPKQKRFPVELAGVAFQQKKYPDAARWIENALRLDPHDEYANDFAGTIFLLMGNLDAALKYWNRIQKPQINALNIDPQIHVQRLLLERAFVFSPRARMLRPDFESSEARLDGLGVFPAYNIRLDARQDGKFDAEFHAIERDGFGDGWLQSLVSVFSGLPYETIYPSYFNIGGSATNFDALVRWDAQKRRAWLSLSWSMHSLPQWRSQISVDGRDENWAIRNAFTGTALVLGSFKLKREVAGGTVTSLHSARFGWTSGAELSHRTYSNVVDGSALNAELVAPGYELKHLASLHANLLHVPEHRFTLDATAGSEFARLWSSPPRLFEKLQGGATVHWLPQAEGETYEFMQRVRGGGIAGTAPVDEMWMIGVERDNDLWLRGHIGTRDGRKGSSPIADRYLLSNTDFYRSLWGNGLISVKAGPWLDVARASAPTSGLAVRQWLVDTGVEVKLSVLGTGVVLTYGRDLRTGNNAFYGSAMQK
jgi:tetratricopeptide (TPR) repeat protein